MSTKPHPVALTAAMLTTRAILVTPTVIVSHRFVMCAVLASALHRLAKGCQRQAVAECNGELSDASVRTAGERLDKRLAKLNAQLAPVALEARRSGDPRGLVLRLYSTDPTKPVPCNCGDGESWAIG